MKIVRDELYMTEHEKYNDYEQHQTVIELSSGEKLVIQVLDAEDKELYKKEFSPKFVNTHFNLIWQDKSAKKPEYLNQTAP